jgi:4-diphosphocytidyl-2-C-methyl-D-erythritol kinase
MVAFPPCKINLGLNIMRKRADGYHDIETIFYPVPWTDILEVIPSDKFVFTATGNVIPGKEEDNLCVRAHKILNAPPAKIHLHKIIPAGAGLGGGSSDAASTLKLLNDVFELKHSKEDLKNYAAQLGSDCAFFIENRPMLGRGRGEILTPVDVDLKGKFIVIIKPDVHVSTAEAYAGVVPKEREPGSEWTNDFEESVFKKYPILASIKSTLYEAGASYASMSGSGSAVFGIFSQKPSEGKLNPFTPSFAGWL